MQAVLLSAVLLFTLSAQSPSVSQRHLDQAVLFEKQGEFDRAAAAYKTAIESARSVNASALIHALDLACTFYQDAGRTVQAEHCLKRLLTVFRGHLGQDHIALNRIYTRLACLYIELGQRGKAEKLGLEAWLKRVEDEIPLSDDRVDLAGTVAALEVLRGNPLKAVAMNQVALGVLEQRQSLESVSGITVLNNLAIAYLELKKPENALQPLELALRIGSKHGFSSTLSSAATHGNLATAQQALGNYDDAVRNVEASLAIVELRCGRESIRTAALLATYAPLLRRLGRKPEAKVAENRARRIAGEIGISAFAGESSVDISELAKRREQVRR